MLKLVEENLAELAKLCRHHEVQQRELFGSAARQDFEPGRSDLDFLVAFQPRGALGAADRFLGLLAGLQDLFHCNIDLIDIRAARNPYLVASILNDPRIKLYAA